MDVKKDPRNTVGKPLHCRAAVARKPGEPLVIEEIIVAPPKAHEVRIKIICTSLCSSDVSFWKRNDHGLFPVILGHEAIGLVESVGDNVDELAKGDTVIPHYLAECKTCDVCKSSSKGNVCLTYPFRISKWTQRDNTSRFTGSKGETLHHFFYVSSLSEYTVVDVSHVTKLDASVPPKMACLLGYGVSTGVGAAWRAANVEKGSSVAIFGLGVIGLSVAEGARLQGAGKIVGVDIDSKKFEIGKRFGITDFVNPRNCQDKSLSEVIIEMTNGGADYCFECVGLADLMQEAFSSCRKGWGKTICLGVEEPHQQLSFSSLLVDHSGKTLMGALLGGLKPKTDIPILAKYYMRRELKLDGFVTHEMKLEDINRACQLVHEGQCLRCVIWMD